MTTLKIAYAADAAIVATNWDALASQAWATLPAFDNASTLHVDVLVGGKIHFDTVTGIILAADSFDIYAAALYDKDVASSYTGGIDTAFTANDASLTEDTEFTPLNLKLLAVVKPEATTADTEQSYNWGPVSIASVFGGIMPQKFILVGHNNSNDAVLKAATSDHVVNAVGINYTNALCLLLTEYIMVPAITLRADHLSSIKAARKHNAWLGGGQLSTVLFRLELA